MTCTNCGKSKKTQEPCEPCAIQHLKIAQNSAKNDDKKSRLKAQWHLVQAFNLTSNRALKSSIFKARISWQIDKIKPNFSALVDEATNYKES